ncbi:MAG: trigger factor [Acidimicrobiales bacterium]
MNSTREILDGDRVKLSVAVDEKEFDQAVDVAFRRIAKEVRLPGFRPGKAPRKILEARLGADAGRQEAIQDAVPEHYVKALIEHQIDAIDSPQFEVTGGESGGALTFTAIVPVRPKVTVTDYQSLRVEIPSPVASDEDVDQQIDALRQQFSSLEDVDRPVEDGDQVTIDIDGTLDGEAVEGLTTSDYLYEVGAGAVVPEIDENLQGASSGDTVDFDADHPDADEDGKLNFSIEIKKVQERVLPEVDDEFAAQASEFATADELREDTKKRITDMKRSQAASQARDLMAQALGELVTLDPPASLIETEVTNRLQDMAMRLQSQGMDMERYLEAIGQDVATLRESFSEGADLSVKVDLALRCVVAAEGLEPDEEKFDEYFALLATQMGSDAEDAREILTSSGRMIDLEADLGKQAAIEWLYERAEIVDEDGTVIDRADLEPPEVEESASEVSDTEEPAESSTATDEETSDSDEPQEEDNQ